MLELQKHLRAGNSLSSLTETLGLKIVPGKKHSNLYSFNYCQINSPRSHPIVRESRGVILDAEDDWRVVSMPYYRFFNLGEGHADTIDLNTAVCMDKLDGSLMTLYYYRGEWNISSRGIPDASGGVSVERPEYTFAELFWDIWRGLGYKLPEETKNCFIFEMMTPLNKIICQYDKSRIVLHGVRNIETLREEFPEGYAAKYGWECVRTTPMSNLANVQELVGTYDPIDFEGFVLRDSNFNRVKVKNPAYVALAHIRESMSTRRMLEIVRNESSEKFLIYFPEFKPLHSRIKDLYRRLIEDIEALYSQVRDIPIQKDFALAIKDCKFKGVLFALRRGDCGDMCQIIKDLNIDTLAELLGLREEIIGQTRII